MSLMKKNLEKLDYIFDNEKVGIAINNVKDNYLLMVNSTFADIHGYKHHELIGTTLNKVFTKESMLRLSEYERNLSYSIGVLSFETTHLKKDGSFIDVSIHITIMKDEKKEVKQRVINIIDISNHKQIENQLVKQRLDYLNLAENLPDAVVRYDKECRRIYVNPEWERINGLSYQEVINRSPIELSSVIAPIAKEYQAKIQAVMDLGKPNEWDFEFKGIDGEFYTYSVRAVPEYDVCGNISGVLTTASNITTRKEKEKEKINEQMRFFFERQLVGMAITSPQKGWIKVNDKLCEMFGYSLEELISMTWEEITHPEDLEADSKQFNRLLNSEIEEYRLEKRFIHKDGSVVFTNISISCVRKEDKSVDYILALIEDITSRILAEKTILKLNSTLEKRIEQRTAELHDLIWKLNLEIMERKEKEALLIKKEQEFRSLAQHAEIPIYRYDSNLQRIYVNPAVEKLTGKSASELVDKPLIETNLVDEEYKCKIIRSVQKVLSDGEADSIEVEFTLPNGSKKCFLQQHIPEFSNNGNVQSVLALGHDISAQKELSLREEMFRTLAENSPNIIMRYDNTCTRIYANPAFSKQTGIPLNELINSRPDSQWGLYLNMLNMSAYEYQNRIKEVIRSAKSDSFSVEWERLCDGKRVSHDLNIVVERNSKGEIKGALAIGHNITERKNIEKRIEYLAHHDALTGLPNRVLLKDRSEQILANAKRLEKRVAVLFVDLDEFKTINDSLGHSRGDEILKTVASRLQRSIRATDTVSRQGGDEFIIILPNINSVEEIIPITNKLLKELKKPFDISNNIISTSASIGISIYPEHGESFEQLLQSADAAMYKAKESGKNAYSIYNHKVKHNLLGLFKMQNDLKSAIKNSEFILHYQPQIDLVKNKIIGVEALIRWQHPMLGIIPPMNFISVSESSGLIVEIGEWVLMEACRQAALWNNQGKEIIVAVNISAVQFRRANLVEIIKHAIKVTGLNPKYLELELTESILIKDTEIILETVKQIKELGVKLSIDDFGTGYSSLAYLKRFAVDKLKIDQSFVKDILKNKEDASIVKTIIQMAKSFNLKSIAEGVENEEVLAVIKEYGCDEVQGYHFAKPMIAEEFDSYYTNQFPKSLI